MHKGGAEPVPVVVLGLGDIGKQIAKGALASPELTLIGAVDTAPELRSASLADVLGVPGLELRVTPDLRSAIGKAATPVVLQATGSRLPDVMPQILECIRLGASVVSTCEELAFPFLKYPELADELSAAAERARVSVLGTGVNPGFALDRLVVTLGQVCGRVRSVRASRTVDARLRRGALQRKVGAGLTEEEFAALVEQDRIGHVGLIESAALCAVGLDLECDDYEEETVAVIAEEDIEGGVLRVPKGRVAGMSQVASGLIDGREVVRLELTIALGVEDAADRVVIDAEPPIHLEIKGGIAGDLATANTVLNAAPRVGAAEPGLLTVLELPCGR